MVARERADLDAIAGLANEAKVAQPPDVHEHAGACNTQAHQGQQRMATRDELGIGAAAEQLDRVLDRLRDLVVELGRDHVLSPPSAASSIARHTRSGVAGMSSSSTPRWDRLSIRAFMTAAGAAIVPVSPTPFTPSGFVGLGVSVRASSSDGSSAALGTRYWSIEPVSRLPSSS